MTSRTTVKRHQPISIWRSALSLSAGCQFDTYLGNQKPSEVRATEPEGWAREVTVA
jgi:hypothetical protein